MVAINNGGCKKFSAVTLNKAAVKSKKGNCYLNSPCVATVCYNFSMYFDRKIQPFFSCFLHGKLQMVHNCCIL